jgi:hypothetical protein
MTVSLKWLSLKHSLVVKSLSLKLLNKSGKLKQRAIKNTVMPDLKCLFKTILDPRTRS